jgi:hypothetical protein
MIEEQMKNPSASSVAPESKVKPIVIDIIQEEGLDKKGKSVKDINGEIVYKRNDYMGLLSGLFARFDSRLYDFKDYKIFLKLKDKFTEGFTNDKKQIELTLDQTVFLKSFLLSLATKSDPQRNAEKQPFPEWQLRTLVGILEQLGE